MKTVEIKLGDIVERITTIKGSDLPPSKQIICVDEELLESFEMLKNAPANIKELFSQLTFEYTKIWRLKGKDYILIWEDLSE